MWRLRHCADQRINEEFEALNNRLLLKSVQFGFILDSYYFSDFLFLQVKIDLRLDELLCLDKAFVDRGDHLEHQV